MKVEVLTELHLSIYTFKLKADNINLRNIHATNFEANTSISEKGVFDVKNFNFNIAQNDW